MTAKKSILFVNDEMHMGGVARVLNTLMASLPQDQYEIDLLILHKKGLLLEEIPSHIHVIEAGPFFHAVDESLSDVLHRKDWLALMRKVRLLGYMKTGLIKGRIEKERKRILSKQYDVEVAAKEGFCTIFTAYGDSKRKINWVLTDYSVRNYSQNHMKLVKDALKEIDLNIADSQKALQAYQEVFQIKNGVAIPNLMDTKRIEEAEKQEMSLEWDPNLFHIVNVARFHEQKSIDRLLNASKYVYDKGYPHVLYLVGGGELEESLRNQVARLEMSHVKFLGYLQNPYSLMKQCDLFVLSSLYEGYATVISESLICGTPVLTTDVSGCQEQITSPDYGWIVENTQEGLNEGLLHVLEHQERCKEMKKGLQEYQYPNAEILRQFIEVL